ncbi:DNA polymerase I [Gordonia phage Puppers]|nr:DNA polymerase I [Gordonia phage Puppers]
MSDMWYRAKDGDGYTSRLDHADPADVAVKHAARDLVESGQAPDLQAALVAVRAGQFPGRRPDAFVQAVTEELAAEPIQTPPWAELVGTPAVQVTESGAVTTYEEAFISAEELAAPAPTPWTKEELAANPIETPLWSDPDGTDPPAWDVSIGEPERAPVAETMAEVLADGPPLVITTERWMAPQIRPLARFTIPDHHAYYPHISAWLATGEPARDALRYRMTQAPTTMALDIEADGLGASSFVLKCATLAWLDGSGETMGVYLDPVRHDEDRKLLRAVLDHAEAIVLHNAPYDVPPLYQHGLISAEAIGKVHDTAVYARMAFPDKFIRKNLESLAARYDVVPAAELTMADVFKSNGLTISEGYRQFDGDRPLYRLGAMADTVATLRILRPLQADTWARLVEGNPFGPKAVDSAGALELMEREQRVNRVMMKRSARGLSVDTDYLHRYEEQHAKELTAARDDLANAGLDPDAGNLGFLLVSKLEELGQLPASWPRTGTGRLRATKDDMEKLGDLGHPLASAARRVSELGKVAGYLDKVNEMVQVTGRVHPQVSILGASATGRMSYSLPELQQFPEDARPIIVSDAGLTSVDWSQIEPVLMANCAQDADYLAGFNAGTADLYAPVQSAANVERKVAKVLLLAVMYGRGATSTAVQLGTTKEHAQTLISSMLNGMPVTRDFITTVRSLGEEYGLITTASGRILPIPKSPEDGRPMAYKAVNYFCQGSAYDVLADTIIRLDDAGLGDSIHLALHDELVVDTEAAQAVREIMEVPPAFLGKWTDLSQVVFRTDANDMGRTWLYV